MYLNLYQFTNIEENTFHLLNLSYQTLCNGREDKNGCRYTPFFNN